MKAFILSLIICLGMVSAAEATNVTHNAKIHHVWTPQGWFHVHEDAVAAARPESAVKCSFYGGC